MHFKKNDYINKYLVTFPHKKGDYAETYRVKDENGKTLFLKLIFHSKLKRYQIDDNGDVLELNILRQIEKHNNICRYIDSDRIIVDGGVCTYIVLDYVSGETLANKIVRGSSLTIYDIKKIIISILEALKHIHSLEIPIIHGEITPSNIFISFTDEKSYLIDFGEAHMLINSKSKKDIEHLNPVYLAPECFNGVSQIQSDLYSIGVILYQLIFEQLPWIKDFSTSFSYDDNIDKIIESKKKNLIIPKVDKFELDEHLIKCIKKSISYKVEDRFQNASDFIKALDGDKSFLLDLSYKSNDKKEKIKEKSPISKKERGKGFSAIAGMEELKKIMTEEVIEPLKNPEIYREYGITIPNGILLFGPPGCGKTFFAKHFAEEVGFNFMFITPASLKSKYVNATQENIAKMFADAEENAPTIIFIDELNELVPDRESDTHEMSKSAVNEMLAQMDRTGEKGIFIIGATNYPHSIDQAILRAGRMDKKYYIGVPDKTARIALFKLYLSNRPIDFGIDYDELAILTENYISADIQLIVNNAARKALYAKSKITSSILKQTIKETQASLSIEEIHRYENIRDNIYRQKSGKSNLGFK